jgi:hypothetical protein
MADTFVSVPSIATDGTESGALINTRHVITVLTLNIPGDIRKSRIMLANAGCVTWVDSMLPVTQVGARIYNAQKG